MPKVPVGFIIVTTLLLHNAPLLLAATFLVFCFSISLRPMVSSKLNTNSHLINQSLGSTSTGNPSSSNTTASSIFEFFDFDAYELNPRSFRFLPFLLLNAHQLVLETAMGVAVFGQHVIQHLRDAVPLAYDGKPCVNIPEATRVSPDGPRLEFFKLIIFLYSNNIRVEGIHGFDKKKGQGCDCLTRLMVETLSHDHNIDILGSLSRYRYVTIDTFINYLLVSSICLDNPKLTRRLGWLPHHQGGILLSGENIYDLPYFKTYTVGCIGRFHH